jgi:hypothetical protein
MATETAEPDVAESHTTVQGWGEQARAVVDDVLEEVTVHGRVGLLDLGLISATLTALSMGPRWAAAPGSIALVALALRYHLKGKRP